MTDFPDDGVFMRFTGQTAMNLGTNGCITDATVLADLLAESHVAVRWVEWPTRFPRDQESHLIGFPEAMELAYWLYRHSPAF